MELPKKSLGQHWLKDAEALENIVRLAEIAPTDTILEVGPGLGYLTKHLVKQARKVMAVELDEALAGRLSGTVAADNLQVISQDILKFDLTQLPADYKVVANIPYYLTGNLLRSLTGSPSPPRLMVLLVQKEVAERIAAQPGQMSVLAVSVQLDYDPELGPVVPAARFEPQPKVDSQIIILKRRDNPLFTDLDHHTYLGIVKAGFSEKRKKLRSSLSGGLHRSKDEIDNLLKFADIDGDARAQELSLDDWYRLYKKRYSAGGVVLGKDGKVAVVDQDGLTWSLPKGGVHPGEEELAAAKREIYEETGLTRLRLVRRLGEYERFAMGLKGEDLTDRPRHITMFLFTTDQTELNPIDPANPQARWVDIDEVSDVLTHPKDKEFFLSCCSQFKSELKKS